MDDEVTPTDDDGPLFPVADDDVVPVEEAPAAELLVVAVVEEELPGTLVDGACDADVPAVALEDDRREEAPGDDEEGRPEVAMVLLAPTLDAAADVDAVPPDDDDDVLPASDVPPVEHPVTTTMTMRQRSRPSIVPPAMHPPVPSCLTLAKPPR